MDIQWQPVGMEDDNVLFADIQIWVQAVPCVLIGISKIFTSITGLEYAFSKAPTNMRSLVMAVNLAVNAFRPQLLGRSLLLLMAYSLC